MKDKEDTINEINKYGELTKLKFKEFEESNMIIKNENENLKRMVEENKETLYEYENIDYLNEERIKYLMNEKDNLEKAIDENRLDLIHKEDKLRSKYEEKEREMKSKFK